MPHQKIKVSRGDGSDGYRKVVIYGPPGVGKTTTAAKAANVLILDCAGGTDFVGGHKWTIDKPGDLAEAIKYLSGSGHGYKAVLIDGVDALYARMTKRQGDRRKDHLTQQDVLHPLLEEIFALPMHVIVVLNDHEDGIGEGEKRVVSYSFDIAPRTTEIMMARADFVVRAYRKEGKTDTYVNWGQTRQLGKARSAEILTRAFKANPADPGVKLREFLSVIKIPERNLADEPDNSGAVSPVDGMEGPRDGDGVPGEEGAAAS